MKQIDAVGKAGSTVVGARGIGERACVRTPKSNTLTVRPPLSQLASKFPLGNAHIFAPEDMLSSTLNVWIQRATPDPRPLDVRNGDLQNEDLRQASSREPSLEQIRLY